jgi:di/tricarboxylate transporter
MSSGLITPSAYAEARIPHQLGLREQQRGEPEPAGKNLEEALTTFRRLGARKDVERMEQAVASLAQELSENLGYPPRSQASAGLTVAGLVGYGMFGGIFLTGLVLNFFELELLPAPERHRFDGLTWLASAAPPGVFLFLGGLGGLAMILILFRAEVRLRVTREVVRQQERVLGQVSAGEWATIAAISVLVLGLVFQPLFHVDAAWLGVAVLAIVVAGGIGDPERYRTGIDWGYLTLYGILLSMPTVLHARLIPIASSVK